MAHPEMTQPLSPCETAVFIGAGKWQSIGTSELQPDSATDRVMPLRIVSTNIIAVGVYLPHQPGH